jgi:PEP-CTERM motif
MKLRPAVLLLGAVLIAAVPVLADGIPHSELTKETTDVLRVNKFESTNNVDLRDSKSSTVPDTFFSGLPDQGINLAGLIDLSFLENVSSYAHGGKPISINGNRGWDSRGDAGDPDTKPVPEPGSFSLLLAGLAAVGFLARRGADSTKVS